MKLTKSEQCFFRLYDYIIFKLTKLSSEACDCSSIEEIKIIEAEYNVLKEIFFEMQSLESEIKSEIWINKML